jgi:hypothetical protein
MRCNERKISDKHYSPAAPFLAPPAASFSSPSAAAELGPLDEGPPDFFALLPAGGQYIIKIEG